MPLRKKAPIQRYEVDQGPGLKSVIKAVEQAYHSNRNNIIAVDKESLRYIRIKGEGYKRETQILGAEVRHDCLLLTITFSDADGPRKQHKLHYDPHTRTGWFEATSLY